MADTYLTWWTSMETDLRKSIIIHATRDVERLHALVRMAYEYGQNSATPPSPSTAPEGCAWLPLEPTEAMVHAAEDLPAPRMFGKVWRAMAGAALASRPAEVDDEGPRLLPRHVFKSDELYEEYLGEVTGWYPITNSLEFGGIKKTDEGGLPPLPEPRAIRAGHGFPKVYALAYTAEQYRQGQHDAVAADRARRKKGGV